MGYIEKIKKRHDLRLVPPHRDGNDNALVVENGNPIMVLDDERWSKIAEGADEDVALILGRQLEHRERTLWYYQGALFEVPWGLVDAIRSEKAGSLVETIMSLLDDVNLAGTREARRAIQFANAMDGDSLKETRMQIPDEVKIFVWRRDDGKCVKCGSVRNLEFDHVIPLSMGGSSTARNLQLLCELHNQQKGASLA